MRMLRLGLALWMAASVAEVAASGVSPYLPLRLSPEIERQIERVLILADTPIVTRPIPAAVVMNALPEACKADAVLCEQVYRYLSRFMSDVALTHAGVAVAASDGDSGTLPNNRGMSSNSAWSAAVRGYWQPGDYLLVNLGMVAYDGDALPTGSVLSLGFEYAQLDVGYREHWFSPMTDSSMLISAQAESMPSLTLSNYTPISRLGLSYQVFLAEMAGSSRIAYQGALTSGKPRLAGLHAAIAPTRGWTLSVNRLMQYGGGARGGTSLTDFFNALSDPKQYDNTSSTLTTDRQFGNQAASFTSRFIYPGRVPFAVSFEYAGEDSSFDGGFRLGNAALTAGVHFPQLRERFDFVYEVSEWQNAWYAHHVYQDGLANEGHVLGHWGAQHRRFNDAVGAQSHMLNLGWQPAFGGLLELRYRTVANEEYSGVDYQRAHQGSVRYSRALGGQTVGGELIVGRDMFGGNYARLAGFLRYGEEGVNFASAGRMSAALAEPQKTALFVDLGISSNRVRVNIADGRPVTTTSAAAEPHVGFGVRRAVSDRNDLGARIEVGAADGRGLLALRALDYRYRWGDHFAFTGFAGAARYDLATPAFGYYFGFGVQWREVLPRWDLSLDARYADKVARDKLLPGDPGADPRPDSFYDIGGVAMYITRRW